VAFRNEALDDTSLAETISFGDENNGKQVLKSWGKTWQNMVKHGKTWRNMVKHGKTW
jgi:hypothetical protein